MNRNAALAHSKRLSNHRSGFSQIIKWYIPDNMDIPGGFESLSHRRTSATEEPQPPEDLSHLHFTLPEALEGNFMESKVKPLDTSV